MLGEMTADVEERPSWGKEADQNWLVRMTQMHRLRQLPRALRAIVICWLVMCALQRHIQDPAQKAWIQERIEAIGNQTEFTVKGKQAIFQRLVDADEFERYLHKKYTGTKRFGMDGGEAVIPALEQILKRGSQLGLNEAVIGMAHRGRLNVLHNLLQNRSAPLFLNF